MFIDASAFKTIIANDANQPRIVAAIERSKRRYTSAIVRLEVIMSTASTHNMSIEQSDLLFDAIIDECSIIIVPITDSISRKAVAAFAAFGIGGSSRAQLTSVECLSYAVATAYRVPILFIDRGFNYTNLISGLESASPTR